MYDSQEQKGWWSKCVKNEGKDGLAREGAIEMVLLVWFMSKVGIDDGRKEGLTCNFSHTVPKRKWMSLAWLYQTNGSVLAGEGSLDAARHKVILHKNEIESTAGSSTLLSLFLRWLWQRFVWLWAMNTHCTLSSAMICSVNEENTASTACLCLCFMFSVCFASFEVGICSVSDHWRLTTLPLDAGNQARKQNIEEKLTCKLQFARFEKVQIDSTIRVSGIKSGFSTLPLASRH